MTAPAGSGRYDIVVVGAGSAGLVTAAGAAGLGASVALVERGAMGGDCLNFGCVPSKALLRSARAVHDARSGGGFGVRGGEGATVDFPAVMARMRGLRDAIGMHDSAARFRDELGVGLFSGDGRFAGRDCVEVGGQRLRFRRAALCTGSRPAIPAIPGLSAAGHLTNETVFSLDSLPGRLAVIGAGPVGCELAQAFARFGSRVTLVGSSPHLLPREDPDAAALLAAVFVREGIDLRLGARVASVARDGTERVLSVVQGDKPPEVLRVDEILVAAGRLPDVEGMGLEAAGIRYDARQGVAVDDRMRTTNRAVYAAGDVCSRFGFTHAADAQARILIANALFAGRRKASSLTIPRCTYTDPEIARAGVTAAEARERGIEPVELTVPLADVDRAVLDGETEGFARVCLRKGSDAILGVTLVGRHAGESIGEITLAMSAGLGLSAIGNTIHPYPTQAEALRKAADAWNRGRLTPFVAKALRAWLRWMRRLG